MKMQLSGRSHQEINDVAGDGLALPRRSQLDDEPACFNVAGDWAALDLPPFELRDSSAAPLEPRDLRIDQALTFDDNLDLERTLQQLDNAVVVHAYDVGAVNFEDLVAVPEPCRGRDAFLDLVDVGVTGICHCTEAVGRLVVLALERHRDDLDVGLWGLGVGGETQRRARETQRETKPLEKTVWQGMSVAMGEPPPLACDPIASACALCKRGPSVVGASVTWTEALTEGVAHTSYIWHGVGLGIAANRSEGMHSPRDIDGLALQRGSLSGQRRIGACINPARQICVVWWI